jgi:hypothetical protein
MNKKTKTGKQIPNEPNQQAKGKERRLTFDLSLLRLEGHARGLSGLLQAKDNSFLLLNGLALIREGDAQLGQLPIKSRNLLFPLLEGCLRPFECATLLLKEALGFFSRQALALEGGSSLSKSDSLLLKLSIHLLARVPLPLKLLLR